MRIMLIKTISFDMAVNLFIYLDPNQWSPAAPSPSFPSIPIQLEVQTRSDVDNVKKSDFYSITQFKPYLLLEEEGYFVIKLF